LSPTTINKYQNIKKNQLDKNFVAMPLSKLNGTVIQSEVNRLSGVYSPKTVHNAHGLISAVLRTFYPDLRYNITLPKIQKRMRDLPTASQIIDIFHGTDLELVVLLGMWQGFRVSEIRGLKKSDFHKGKLSVNRVIVTVAGENIEKSDTKTIDSRRELSVPPLIQSMVDKVNGEYITTLSGVGIYKRFKRAVLKHGLDITFHDLRHINASVMLALKVPDKYAMERGGWSTTSTLKRVYQETFSDERIAVDNVIDSYFEDIYDTKYDTKIENH
jgi:integrase